KGDRFSDQRRFGWWEELTAGLGGASDVLPQRYLRLDDGANGRRRHLRRVLNKPVRRGNRGHGVVEGGRRTVTAAHIEHDGAHTAADSDFRAHAVGPKSIYFAVFESFGCGHTEIDASTQCPRDWHDLHAV